jgi:pyrroloquinoline quinone biosynthesis protein B
MRWIERSLKKAGVFGLLLSASAHADPYVQVLGVAQDAGHPQAACDRICCSAAWMDPALGHRVASLAIVDPESNERWIIDATPDFRDQLRTLDEQIPVESTPGIDGILLTHGHMGHYTGLVHLGREAMSASRVPVHALPRMAALLRESAPWELLLRLENIEIREIAFDVEIPLNDRITIRPIEVPHRGEYTETAAFVIRGPDHAVLYLPDIDKWDRFDTPIESLIAQVDRAYVDGTFFAGGEIPGRSMAEVPHPFVVESLERFAAMPVTDRAKIAFLHFNHSNPLLQPSSEARTRVEAEGCRVASEGERFGL